jgi:hypothetical protein
MSRVHLVPAAALVLALSAGLSAPARAERPASKGIYAEAGLGGATLLGSNAQYAAVGPSLALRLGTDLFSWLSVGVHLAASSHEALVPPPPEGEWFQLYRGFGDVRLGFRHGALAMFVEGGAGAGYISSNVLAKVMVLDPGERFSLAFTGGAGAEYQLQNRHYAFGLAGAYWMLPQFASTQGAEGRLYLRYTY